MTKKEILIRDLCGRLPYKPMVHIENSATGVSYDQELNPLHITMLTESDIVIIKPYLRHGFDTKEERQEYSKIDDVVEAMDYMLAKHIDCRDMVEDGSALEAPEGMYKHEVKLEFNESGSRIEVGCKIRLKTNPDVILRIVSDDCHGDKFECSNGSVLSLKQINKYYDFCVEENKGTIVIN